MSPLQVIKPKSCGYGCGLQIYWNTSENTYFEVFSQKKHSCPNRVNKTATTSNNTTTNTKPTYYSKKPWISQQPKAKMSNSFELLSGPLGLLLLSIRISPLITCSATSVLCAPSTLRNGSPILDNMKARAEILDSRLVNCCAIPLPNNVVAPLFVMELATLFVSILVFVYIRFAKPSSFEIESVYCQGPAKYDVLIALSVDVFLFLITIPLCWTSGYSKIKRLFSIFQYAPVTSEKKFNTCEASVIGSTTDKSLSVTIADGHTKEYHDKLIKLQATARELGLLPVTAPQSPIITDDKEKKKTTTTDTSFVNTNPYAT